MIYASATLTVRDAAQYLGVSEPTVWRMLRGGELPRTKIRGRTLVRRVDLDIFLARAARARHG
jgi:excisionase family DNA binding protein